MDIDEVPQEGNATLAGLRKAVYARGADNRIVTVASAGWEVEEIVTQQAARVFDTYTAQARARVVAGISSPLEYWMYAQRMDLATLAQSSGIWRWRIRRHFRPEVFARQGPRLLDRYADALGISRPALCELPHD
ncbi:MAG: hypothetical protein IV085_05210 [Thiobacillus sp.]|nr:hypothetical protein [Thiobacillus sp.]